MKDFLMSLSILCISVTNSLFAEQKTVSLRPQWVPQAQFAGYYVAAAKGFYQKQGLDLTIRPGGPGIMSLNNVASQQDTFATGWLSGGIKLVSQGAPLVNIGQFFQTSGLMLVSHKDSQIKSPKDFNGKKIGLWPDQFTLPAVILFKKFGVKPVVVTQEFSMDSFLKRELDVASAMSYNEYNVVLQSGLKPKDLQVYKFGDLGLTFPEDGIYVHRETVEKHPELCAKFIKASIEGWIYAFEHKDEAIQIIMKEAEKAKTGTTVLHQKMMLDEVEKLVLYRTGKKSMGELAQRDFDFVKKSLDLPPDQAQKVSYENFYRTQVK